MLRGHGACVTAHCKGEVSSAAITVLLAASKRVSEPNCRFLVHSARGMDPAVVEAFSAIQARLAHRRCGMPTAEYYGLRIDGDRGISFDATEANRRLLVYRIEANRPAATVRTSHQLLSFQGLLANRKLALKMAGRQIGIPANRIPAAALAAYQQAWAKR